MVDPGRTGVKGCWELQRAAQLASIFAIVDTFWWVRKKNLCCILLFGGKGREERKEKEYRLWRQDKLGLALSLIAELMYKSEK